MCFRRQKGSGRRSLSRRRLRWNWEHRRRPAASQLEATLEARCREELGAEVTIRIELEETAEGVQVHSLTVTPMGEAEETRDAVEELFQHTLGVSPVWNVPGGENAP